MKRWKYFFVIVGLGAVQVTLLNYARLFGLKPDLLLICAILASLIFEQRLAFVFSVSCGLFKDAFNASTFGLNIILFSFWSLLIVKVSREISLDDEYRRAGLVLVIALLQNSFTGIMLMMAGEMISLGIFLRIALLGSFYTALVSLLVFRIAKKWTG